MAKHTLVKSFANHRGRPSFGGHQTPEQVEEYKELAKALNEEARENWDNPEFHRQVARDLSSELDYGFTFENMFSTYFSTETVGEFDRVILKERRGLKVYYTARGGHVDESNLRTEQWELPRDTLGFHIRESEDKLRANFAEEIGAVADLGGERLEAEVNRRIFNTLQAAVPNSSDYYVSAAGLSKTALDDMIREVKDAIKPNGQGPVPVTIIGRASMVDQISDFTGFAEEAVEEIRLRGRLGVYRGAQIVQLVNYTDEDGESYIDEDELWVFGGNVGKFALYGDLRVKTWSENTVDYQHYRAVKDIGGLVHHPEQSRRFIDTSA
jgi:hypothetical protein